MANKEASIKLTLNNQQFVVSVKTMVSETEKGGSKIGKALSEGFNEGKKSVGEMFRSVKGLIGLGAALGGAFSFEEGIKHALDMEGKYRAIARQIGQVTGRSIELKQVQEDIADAGKHSTVNVEALSDAFLDLLNTTGNADFASAAMHAASEEATRTGKSFQSLASLAGDVNKKFGISADKIGETLRVITANTDIGGPKLDELANGFDLMGAVAEAGGLRGASGLNLMLGMLNKTAPILGRFSESGRAMQGVFSALQAPEAFNKIRQMTAGTADSGFVKKLINAPDALARLDMILKKGGTVRKEFEKAITDRKEVALYKILTEPFDKSVADAMASGKKGQDAMEAGSQAFKASLMGLSRAGDSKQRADEELAQRMATSKAKIDQAMKEIEEAFAQKEVLDAVKQLMGQVPKLVHIFAQLIEFFSKHPGLGVAAVVGGTAAKGALAPLAGAALGAGGGLIKNGASAALKWAGWGAGAAGESAAVAAGGTVAAEGATVATTAATAGGGVVAAGGAAALAAPLAAIGGATAAVYQFLMLKDASKSEGGIWNAVSGAVMNENLGGRAATPEEWEAKQAKLAEAQDKQARKVEKAADVHDALNRAAERATMSLEKFGRAAGGAAPGSTTGDGVSKGPGAPSGGKPGFNWDNY